MSKLLSKNKNRQIYFSLLGMKVLTNEELKLKGWTKGGKGWGSEEAKQYQRDVLHFTGADVDGKIGPKSLAANDKLVNPFYVKNVPVGTASYSSKSLDFTSDNYAVGEPKTKPGDLKLIARAKQYGFDAKSVNQIKAILSDLQSRGLYSGKIDGIWGPKTLAGYEQMKTNLQNKRAESQVTPPNISLPSWFVQGGIQGEKVQPLTDDEMLAYSERLEAIPDLVIPIDRKKAAELYSAGPGTGVAASTLLFHILAPQRWSMPHTKGVKDQGAALIAYNEGLNKLAFDENGHKLVGYDIMGDLSNQSLNVNLQTAKNNAYGKIVGTTHYDMNEDGSAKINDAFLTFILRDFNNASGSNVPARKLDGDELKQYRKDNSQFKRNVLAFKGLMSDLNTPYMKLLRKTDKAKSLEWLAENFATRQGKIRDNSIEYDKKEINRRNM